MYFYIYLGLLIDLYYNPYLVKCIPFFNSTCNPPLQIKRWRDTLCFQFTSSLLRWYFSLNSKRKKKNPDVEEGNLENHGEQELAEQAPTVNLLEHDNKSIFF